MTNKKEKPKKTFKECIKEQWEFRKWGVYIGFAWLLYLFLHDFITSYWTD